jgi:hypothetical protein
MSPGAAQRDRAARPHPDIDSLGLALLIAVSLAWITGAPYLVVRAGFGLPFRLILVDGIHCYVGLAMAVFLVAKVRRVGWRRSVPAVPDASLWDRWVSLSIAILYSAVMISGLVALLPLGDDTRTAMVNAHLLTAVWAAAPTTWHVVTHRARLRAAASRARHGFGIAGLTSSAFVLALAVPLLLGARAVAPLTQAHAGLSWQPRGQAVLLDRLDVTPDGRTIVAGGEGLFVSQDGQRWSPVEGFGVPNGRTLVLGLHLTNSATYVGTSDGVYMAPTATGPYRRLPSPAREVHGIEVDPTNPAIVWVAAYNGVWLSRDGGAHWTSENAGLADATGSWALRFFHGTLFLSEVTSVDRWNGVRWVQSNSQAYVNALDPSADGTHLFATSMGQGITAFDGQRWSTADAGMAEHVHGGVTGIHVDSATDVGGGTLYAGTMVSGIAESRDGARTWFSVWPSLRGDVWRVRLFNGALIAATDFGLFSYGPVPPAPAAGALWWVYLVVAAVAAGAVIVGAARIRGMAMREPAVAEAEPATMRRS